MGMHHRKVRFENFASNSGFQMKKKQPLNHQTLQEEQNVAGEERSSLGDSSQHMPTIVMDLDRSREGMEHSFVSHHSDKSQRSERS